MKSDTVEKREYNNMGENWVDILGREFNKNQLEVINADSGEHLVLAPPGCGKTEVLAARIIHARNRGVQFEDMLCLTFTNRAARGMRDRINMLHYEHTDELFVGNVHRFCSEMLFSEDSSYVPQNTSILDDEDQNEVYAEIVRDITKKLQDNQILFSFGEIKRDDVFKFQHYIYQLRHNHPSSLFMSWFDMRYQQSIFPAYKSIVEVYDNIVDIFINSKNSQIQPYLGSLSLLLLAKLYEEYKEEHTLLDFDDLLLMSYTILSGRDSRHKRYSWIQVDEVQDLNPMQIALIDLIKAQGANVVFLGDQQQAIFSFIGAKVSTLNSLMQRCEKNLHTFEFNYRSPEYLLSLFNDYAKTVLGIDGRYLPDTINKTEKPYQAVSILQTEDTDTAKMDIAERVETLMADYPEERVAILVSSNKEADAISETLDKCDLPNFKISGRDVFSSKEVKFLKSHLRVMLFEESQLDWTNIYHWFGVGSSPQGIRGFLGELQCYFISPADLLMYEDSTYFQEFEKNMGRPIVVFDTETTGVDVFSDDIIQISGKKLVNGQVAGECDIYMRVGDRQIPAYLSSIENPLVEQYAKVEREGKLVSREEGLRQFLKFSEGCLLVGHNAAYDYHILDNNLKRNCRDVVLQEIHPLFFDTYKLMRIARPGCKTYRLGNLVEELKLTKAVGVNHLADNDVDDTISLLKYVMSQTKAICDLQRQYFTYCKNKTDYARKGLSEYRPVFLKTMSLLYDTTTRRDTPIIETVLREIFEKFIKNGQKEDESRVEKVIEFIGEILIDAREEPFLKTQIDNHINQIITLKESDLCSNDKKGVIEEKIFVCTVHKAKGLEFEHVIIADGSDNSYPNYYCKTIEARQENARLLYVAISRAMKTLTIVCPKVAVVNSEKNNSTYRFVRNISPFLAPLSRHFENINI